jgi:DNA-binding NarL/FixJ family response regulator
LSTAHTNPLQQATRDCPFGQYRFPWAGWQHFQGTTMTSSITSSRQVRILIVDDHPVFRMGLGNLLESEPDFQVVGKVSNGDAALRAVHQLNPHVVLLDLSMPGLSGFETLARIHVSAAAPKTLVLTSSESPDDVNRVRAGGARGYLTKDVDHHEIIDAIRDVSRGTAWIQRGAMPTAPSPLGRGNVAGISARELEVLGFVRNGYSNAEIGRVLGITERTVKAHVKALCDKLGAADRAEAVAKGFDVGLLKTAGTL